jgi:hypothetical protein
VALQHLLVDRDALDLDGALEPRLLAAGKALLGDGLADDLSFPKMVDA